MQTLLCNRKKRKPLLTKICRFFRWKNTQHKLFTFSVGSIPWCIKLSHSLAAWHILVIKCWLPGKTQKTKQMNFSVEKATVLLRSRKEAAAGRWKSKSLSRWTVVWMYHFTGCLYLPLVSLLYWVKYTITYKFDFSCWPCDGPWKAIITSLTYFIWKAQTKQS